VATATIDRETLAQARRDPAVFAEVLCGGQALWAHQVEVAASDARYRVILAGRRAGKSRLLAVLALHAAFRKPKQSVVIVSVGEVASLRVLADVAELCSGPLLNGSVVDELKSLVTLTNGSTIASFPASMRQIRGVGADLLIIDEAAFVPRDIWSAAFPSIADRVARGAKVIIASTPWPIADSWFREWHQRGLDGDQHVASWWWPSSVNPHIGDAELEDMRAGMSAEEYEREIEARWTSEEGAYFTAEELDGAVVDYPLLSPERVASMNPWDPFERDFDRCWPAACGVDYGFRVDANAAVLVSPVADGGANKNQIYYVPWLESHTHLPYADFADRLVDVARGYRIVVFASETNGVGEMPTQELRRKMQETGLGAAVAPVWTDQRRKMSGFSKIKVMLGRDLILPRHPELLRELRSLEFERTDAGGLRIAARAGYHDDLSMALLGAVSCIRPGRNPDASIWGPDYQHVRTARGAIFPAEPRPLEHALSSFMWAEGAERGNAW
jgi:hypothetical protein